MSDSEATVQLLGSKPSENRSSFAFKTEHAKPTKHNSSIKNNNDFLLYGPKTIFEPFTPIQSYVTVSVSMMAGLAFGFDMTIGINLLLSLGSVLDLNCFEHRMLINGWIAGAIVGSIFGGFIMDKCGRRGIMLGSSLILSFSCFLGITSGTYLIPFIPRFLSGCSVCSLLMAQTIYITETSRICRSKTIVSQQIALQFGVLCSGIVGMQNATNQSNLFFYVVQSIICTFGISIFFLTYFFLPESPHFIVSRETKIQQPEQQQRKNGAIRSDNVLFPFIQTVSLVILAQLCGRPWVLYYAPRIFSLTGICFSVADSTVALAISVVKIGSTFILLFTVTKLGIRISILISLVVMSLALSFLGTIAAYDQMQGRDVTVGRRVCHILPVYDSIGMLPLVHDTELKFSDFETIITGDTTRPPFPLLPTPVALQQNAPDSSNPMKCPWNERLPPSDLPLSFRVSGVILVLIYETGYTLGYGSLGWLLASEMYPTKWRARGLAVSIATYFFTDFCFQMIFLEINLPIYGLFIIFSFLNMFSFTMCIFMIPDTKNLSLAQIQKVIHEIPANGSGWFSSINLWGSCSRQAQSDGGRAHI